MAINNVEQYVIDSLAQLLNAVLAQPNMVRNDILLDYWCNAQDKANATNKKQVDNFIKTYCSGKGNKAIDIPIYFTFPDELPSTPFLLVQFKAGDEAHEENAIGNLVGNITSNYEGMELREHLPVVVTTDSNGNKVAQVTPKHPIYQVYSVRQSTTFTYDNHTITLPYVSTFDKDSYVDVIYSVNNKELNPDLKECTVIPTGITTIEQVAVDFCSNNLNELRYMTAIFKAIKSSWQTLLSSNGNLYLPTITLQGTDLLSEVTGANNSVLGQQLYTRRLEVTYHVTNSINRALHGTYQDFKFDDNFSE